MEKPDHSEGNDPALLLRKNGGKDPLTDLGKEWSKGPSTGWKIPKKISGKNRLGNVFELSGHQRARQMGSPFFPYCSII